MTKDVLQRKARRLLERLTKIEALVRMDLAQFTADESAHDLCAFYLILAIEDCAALAEHLIADREWDSPESAADAFVVLARHNVIDTALGQRMREAVGMRNVLVHQYTDTDWSLVYSAARDLSRIRELMEKILRFAGADP